MHVTCPRCQMLLDCPPELSGQVATCPRCQQPFTAPRPGLVEVSKPEEQFPAINVRGGYGGSGSGSSPVFISTGHRPLPRLQPTGWFGNAFGTTMGVILALATVFVGVPILLCGGCLVLGGIGAANMPAPPATTVVQQRKILKSKASGNADGDAEFKPAIQIEEPVERLTMAKFQQVRTGMSKAEVFGILGNDAELLSENDIAGFTTQMYMWKGGAFGIANCNVMFQNGKVASKAQFGLK